MTDIDIDLLRKLPKIPVVRAHNLDLADLRFAIQPHVVHVTECGWVELHGQKVLTMGFEEEAVIGGLFLNKENAKKFLMFYATSEVDMNGRQIVIWTPRNVVGDQVMAISPIE